MVPNKERHTSEHTCPGLMSRSHPGWVCGEECLRLLSLLLDINKDFLPTRQSQTPDHLPGRTQQHIPQSWQLQAANTEQLAPFGWSSIILFPIPHVHTRHILSLAQLHPEFANVRLCVYAQLDITGGNRFHGDRDRNNPSHTHTHTPLQKWHRFFQQ